jgi:hypothetical protein
MKKKILSLIILTFVLSNISYAQNAEIKISLNESFFEVLLNAVFKNLKEPRVSLGAMLEQKRKETEAFSFVNADFVKSKKVCDESVRLKQVVNGVRTAVRFRQGKIYAPIAFQGNYNPPLIGCIEFEGWAETNIELAFDKNKRALIGNARVLNVNLGGTGGLGGGFLARLVQSSIDTKVNPIELLTMDKISFTLPVQEQGSLRMKALAMRHRINNGSLDVYISYQFLKTK